MTSSADPQGEEPKVQALEKLLDYQENAIVSREIIKKEKGIVTLFAFDKGQGLSEHISPFDALVFVLDGEVEVTISKKPYLLKKGETILMPSGEPHALRAEERLKILLVMARA